MLNDDLFLRVQQGDEKAFEQLYIMYYYRVVTFIMGLTKSYAIAEDLAQDVFIKLWDSRTNLNPDLNPNNYIFTISRNLAINYIKQRMVQSDTIEENTSTYRQNTVEDSLFAKEISLLIEMIVSEMPEQRQRIFRMSRENGLKNEEIAHLLGISKKTVENQISLALKELKQAITFFLVLILCS